MFSSSLLLQLEAAGLGNGEYLPPGLSLQLLGSLQVDRQHDPAVPTTGPLYGGLTAPCSGSGGAMAVTGPAALSFACNSQYLPLGAVHLPGSGMLRQQQQQSGGSGGGLIQGAPAGVVGSGVVQERAGAGLGEAIGDQQQQQHMLDAALTLLNPQGAGPMERGASGSSTHSQDMVDVPDTVKGSRGSADGSQAAAAADIAKSSRSSADGSQTAAVVAVESRERLGVGAGVGADGLGSGVVQPAGAAAAGAAAAGGVPVLRRSPSSRSNMQSVFAVSQLESAFAAANLQQLQLQPQSSLGKVLPATAGALAGRARGGSVSCSGSVPTAKLSSDLQNSLHMLPGLQNASSLPVSGSRGFRAAASENPRLCSFTDLFSLPTLSCSLATLPAEAMMPGVGGCGGPFSPTNVMTPTGGLMAPFSPLPRASSMGLRSTGSVGAVFPECATASAVTDLEMSVDLGRELGQLGPTYSALMVPVSAAVAGAGVGALVARSSSGGSKGSSSTNSSTSGGARGGLSQGLLSLEVNRAGSGVGGSGGVGAVCTGMHVAGAAARGGFAAGGAKNGDGAQQSDVVPATCVQPGSVEQGGGVYAAAYQVVHPVHGTPVYSAGSSRNGSYSNLQAMTVQSSRLSNSSGAGAKPPGHGPAHQAGAATATAVPAPHQRRLSGTSPLPSPNSKGILRHERPLSPGLKSVRFSFDDGINEAALSDVPLSSPSSAEGGVKGNHGSAGGSGVGLRAGLAGEKPWEQSYHDAEVPGHPSIKAVYGGDYGEDGGVYGSNSSSSSGGGSSLYGSSVGAAAALAAGGGCRSTVAAQQQRQRVNGCWYSGGDADSYQSLQAGSPVDSGMGARGLGGRATGGKPPAKPLVPWGKGVHPVLGAMSLPKPRDNANNSTGS